MKYLILHNKKMVCDMYRLVMVCFNSINVVSSCINPLAEFMW
jgi:hypothetical protein